MFAMPARIVPTSAASALAFAWAVMSMNFGIATPARMARTAITTTSSMSVKPWFFFGRIFFLSRWLTLAGLVLVDDVDHVPHRHEDGEGRRADHHGEHDRQGRLDEHEQGLEVVA